MRCELTQDILKSVLRYGPETGHFTWLVKTNNNMEQGMRAGHLLKSGYIAISIGSKLYRAHNLAWLYMTGEWPLNEVDHKNRCGADNWWKNLRPATHSQNMQNTKVRSDNKSGIKGVAWCESEGKWRSNVSVNGKRIVKRFSTIEEAIASRKKAEQKHYTHAVQQESNHESA
jgi:hypothetical protein